MGRDDTRRAALRIASIAIGLLAILIADVNPRHGVAAQPSDSPDSDGGFSDGEYVVGDDLEIGTYIADGFDGTCTVTRSGAGAGTGAAQRTLAWVGRAVLELHQPGATIQSDGCGDWLPADASTTAVRPQFGDGAYAVGTDIAPGVYQSSADSERCFWFFVDDWQYRSDASTPIVAWLVGAPVVEIPETAFGFYSVRCGTWTPRRAAIPDAPATRFGDGSHLVGIDVEPGRYVASGDDASSIGGGSCIWYRTAPVVAGSSNVPAGGNGSQWQGRQIMDVAGADAGIYSRGCGDWSPLPTDADPDAASTSTEFGAGTYRVGTDIAPGVYVAEVDTGEPSAAMSRCEWQLLDGFSGAPGDVTRASVGLLRGIVRVLETDVGFRSAGCQNWRRLDTLGTVAEPQQFPDGEHIVGVHVAPGLYAADGAASGRCFWRRVSDFTGASSAVLGVRNPVGRVVARIVDGDAGFESHGCGKWVPVHEPESAASNEMPASDPAVATWFGSGTWIVGDDVRAGLYSAAPAEGDTCFWGRFSDFTGAPEDLVAGRFSFGSAVLMVDETDAGVYSDRCGRWVLESSLPGRTPLSTFGDGVYIVGSEISPGNYTASASTTRPCEWVRLSGFGGADFEQIAIVKADGTAYATVRHTDLGFASAGCDQWRPLQPQPVVEQPAEPTRFSDGVHAVGSDVAPGVYVAMPAASTRCRWARLSDWSWTGGVIVERVQRGRAIAETLESDAGFYSHGCGEWIPAGDAGSDDRAADPATTFADGDHRIGIDIAPGLYLSDQRFAVGDCRWRRVSAFTGAETSVIARGGSRDGDWLVRIAPADRGFSSSGCGTWTTIAQSDDDALTTEPAVAFSDGVHRIGTDVLPGVYTTDIGEHRYRGGNYVPPCRWTIVTGFSHEPSETLEAGTGWGEQRVELAASDAGVVAVGCGEWVRVGDGE